jgi:hypothetical protein
MSTKAYCAGHGRKQSLFIIEANVFSRSFSKLKAKEKCRISANWKHGYYKEKIHYTGGKYVTFLLL